MLGTVAQRSVKPSNIRRSTDLQQVHNAPVIVLYWMKSVLCEGSYTIEIVL